MQYLTNPAWLAVFVGILAVFVPTIISIWFYFKQRSRKEISYQIISDISLFNINEDFKDKLQILVDGKPLSDIHAVLLRIWNSGNVPIPPHDYIDPITFILGDKTEVLSLAVRSTEPSHITNKVSLRQETGKIILEPILLNKKYSIDIVLMLNNFVGKIEAKALIIGLNDLRNTGSSFDRIRNILRLSFWGAIIYSLFLAAVPIIPLNILLFPFTFLPHYFVIIFNFVVFLEIVFFLYIIYRYSNKFYLSN